MNSETGLEKVLQAAVTEKEYFLKDYPARRRGQRKGYLRDEHSSWLLTYRVYDQTGRAHRETVTIGPSTGMGRLTLKQAERFAWDHYLSKVDQIAQQPRALMSIGDFWDKHFKPAAQIRLKKTTRNQYFSLYKQWIQPIIARKRLATLEVTDVEQVIGLAIQGDPIGTPDRRKGVSPATARHIRKVISAIYTRAKKLRIASGDNPAGLADAPAPERVREKIALSAAQMQTVLQVLEEPVRTMALTAVLTSMNVSELCGLRWKHVNLTPDWTVFDGEAMPPFCVAVRQHFSCGEVGTLKTGNRKRNVPLPEMLVGALATLKARPKFNGVEDVVFCSKRGTPLSENNTRKRDLMPIAKNIGVSRLGWHVFRYSHATFTESIGMHAKDRQMLMGHGSLDQTDRYTAEDHERMRAGLNQIAAMLVLKAEKAN